MNKCEQCLHYDKKHVLFGGSRHLCADCIYKDENLVDRFDQQQKVTTVKKLIDTLKQFNEDCHVELTDPSSLGVTNLDGK